MTSTDEAELQALAGAVMLKCSWHCMEFPQEDPILPWSEFLVDPVTLWYLPPAARPPHEHSCNRCTMEHYHELEKKAQLGRVLSAQREVELGLYSIAWRHKGKQSKEYAVVQAHLQFLRRYEQLLRAEKEVTE